MLVANKVFGVRMDYSSAGRPHTKMERIVLAYWVYVGLLVGLGYGLYKLITWLISR